MKKVLIVAAIVALIAAFENFVHETPQVAEVVHEAIPETKPAEPIRLVFVGDIMLDRGVRISVGKYLNNGYHALFANADYLKNADIAFANLEGTVGDGTTKRTSKFFFRMDPAGITALKDAGVDVVSFANNHIGDFGQNGFEESLRYLQKNAISYAGAGSNYTDASTPRVFEIKGTKIGYIGFTDIGSTWMKATDTRAGILLGSDPNLADIIAAAKKQVDILVVSFHWGNEYSPVTKRQETLAHLAIDNGADIVVGHHPHVMQKTDTYNGKPIFYSLGNYIFDQVFSPYTMEGMVGEVTINPKTLSLTTATSISKLDTHFVPQTPTPFAESSLLTKSFQP